MSQSPPRPPRTASGFTPQPGVRQTTSFKIRAESRKSKPHVPPPTVVLVEDLIPKYDLELEDLKKWLEERFPGQDFEDKIVGKKDKYHIKVPEKLTEEEKSKINELRKVVEAPKEEPPY